MPMPAQESESDPRAPVAGPAPQPPDSVALSTQVTIDYYTDPLCSWSWAFEPQWRRLRYEFGDRIAWQYHMGGMIADWSSFHDPLNSVNRPAQFGPLWFQARTISGMPLDELIWLQDPPASSYPAGIAFQAAARQGPAAAEAYLRRMREAVVLERRNIARPEVLVALADELAAGSTLDPPFDAGQFRCDLDTSAVQDAFREDLKEASYREIGRFPALIMRYPGRRSLIIVGYRPYGALLAALAEATSGVVPVRAARDPVEYVRYWGRITAREVAEALGLPPTEAARQLDAAVAAGTLARAPVPPGIRPQSYQPAPPPGA